MPRPLLQRKRLALRTDKFAAETVYDPLLRKARFAVYDPTTEKVFYTEKLKDSDGQEVMPEDGGAGRLFERRTILAPSAAEAYQSEAELMQEIEGFIRAYMLMDNDFYLPASHYVLLTWAADGFPALPYLRARGDTGTGKSRFLKVLGSICYCPVFASGATTASPVFRIYELYPRATFLFDEADWSDRSDEYNEIIKILNVGYEKGMAVLRSSKEGNDIEPRAYDVYGPKILATRNVFSDSALESRCFTVALRDESDLSTIPKNVGETFWLQAQSLRNKLLLWRFHHFKVLDEMPDMPELESISPRLQMIMMPLLLIRESAAARDPLIAYAKQLHEEMKDRRAMDVEGQIMRAVVECLESRNPLLGALDPHLTIKEIMERINQTRTAEGETEGLSARKIHNILRTRLNLNLKRMGTDRRYVLTDSDEYLYLVAKKFGYGFSENGEGGGDDGSRAPELSLSAPLAVSNRRVPT